MDKPLISIITVTYNNLQGLKQTIDSVATLSYSQKQHIIIDGNSTDGTGYFLETTCNKTNTTFISEPDNGIYDAMNKGIRLVKDGWIIFMNAGDIFTNKAVLDKIIFPKKISVLYGNCQVNYPTGFNRLMPAKPLSQFWKGLPFSHQTVFMPAQLLLNGFSTTYSYCADYDLLYRLFIEKTPFINTTITIADITAGGVSDSKRHAATNEVYAINKTIQPNMAVHFYFLPKIALSWVIVKIKSILPSKWQNTIYKIKYK